MPWQDVDDSVGHMAVDLLPYSLNTPFHFHAVSTQHLSFLHRFGSVIENLHLKFELIKSCHCGYELPITPKKWKLNPPWG